jgi:pantetheine-phosphate adenylyltransferase
MAAEPNEPMKQVTAICPGSYDPVTYGHLDLIERGARVFDRLIVAVLQNAQKQPLFALAERIEMLKDAIKGLENVEIDVFGGLLVDFARQKKAQVIVRGIRAVSDYEYELQMAMMNRKLEPHLETVFMLPAETFSYLSSSLVKEIAGLGGSVQGLVPPLVEARLKAKVS